MLDPIEKAIADIAVPPAEGPFAGEMLVTLGAGEGSYVYVHVPLAVMRFS